MVCVNRSNSSILAMVRFQIEVSVRFHYKNYISEKGKFPSSWRRDILFWLFFLTIEIFMVTWPNWFIWTIDHGLNFKCPSDNVASSYWRHFIFCKVYWVSSLIWQMTGLDLHRVPCYVFQLNVSQLQFESGKMIQASKYGLDEEEVEIELTEDEQKMAGHIKVPGAVFSVALLLLRLVYSRSVPWLLMPWLLVPLGHQQPWYSRADSRFVPGQWKTALLCDDVSHWLDAGLENVVWKTAAI